jgi:hypothetical protein
MNLAPSLPSAASRMTSRPSSSARIAGPILIASAAAVFLGSGIVASTLLSTAAPRQTSDPCGVPTGLDLGTLDPSARTLTARRLMACNDLRFGRITREQYATTVAAIDERWTMIPKVPPQTIWASTVRGFSTQYSTPSWSAAQVLGAPNVYPAAGDQTAAWASLGADDRAEWLEVGFDQPRPVSGVEVFETYNPGAVTRVELITTSGRRIVAYAGAAAPRGGSYKREIQVACTGEPVAAVRVELDSKAVPGWNEIDAIGVVPCE